MINGKIAIKPLSVNQAYKGRRFSTKKHKKYVKDVLSLLPQGEINSDFYQLEITFGFSSSNADIDNPLKVFQDCLQKKYDFNDRLIKRCVIDVEKVKKGKEFIKFKLSPFSWNC